MRTRQINEMFPEMPGTKTYAGSQRRINKLLERFQENPEFGKCMTVVCYRPTTEDYIPVLIMHDDFGWALTGVLAFNVGVAK